MGSSLQRQTEEFINGLQVSFQLFLSTLLNWFNQSKVFLVLDQDFLIFINQSELLIL